MSLARKCYEHLYGLCFGAGDIPDGIWTGFIAALTDAEYRELILGTEAGKRLTAHELAALLKQRQAPPARSFRSVVLDMLEDAG